MKRVFEASVALLFVLAAGAQELDRIAVVMGNKDVITQDEIREQIRLTAFLNGENFNYSPESMRTAAQRLVDQYLIRREMTLSRYPQPEGSESDKMLAKYKKEHFKTDAQYHAALDKYGLNEEDLKDHLLWQLTALRFTDFRFQPQPAPPDEPLREHLEAHGQKRAAAHSGNAPPYMTDTEETAKAKEAVPPTVDEQLNAWLEQARKQTKIQFREEALR